MLNAGFHQQRSIDILSVSTEAFRLFCLKWFIRPPTDENRRCLLIVDDTFLGRTGNKHVELVSLVHDHTEGKTKRGFQLLTMVSQTV